jgi:hypothetical protein
MSNVTLYQGDSRTIDFPPVDAVITDPVWPNCPDHLLPGWRDPFELLQTVLERITAKRIVIVLRYDSDPRFLSAVPARWPFFRVQELRYAIPGYNGRKLGGFEFAYCFGEPVASQPGRRVIPGMGPVVTKPTPANGHPAPRAIEHFRWLVNWWTEPDETILDPFMGSGTTGLAAAQMGRNFIGAEIEPEYFGIAEQRIKDMTPMLFTATL